MIKKALLLTVLTLSLLVLALNLASALNVTIIYPTNHTTTLNNGTTEYISNTSTSVGITFRVYNDTAIDSNITKIYYSIDDAANVTITINNGTGVHVGFTNLTVGSGQLLNLTGSNLSEGVHTVAIGVSNLSDNFSSAKVTFYVNNFASLAFSANQVANGYNSSANSYSVNVSFLTTAHQGDFGNLSMILLNWSTAAQRINTTRNQWSGSNISANITWKGISSGWYNFTVTLTDNNTRFNYSISRMFIIDTIAPTQPSPALPSCGTYSSGGTIEKDTLLTCTCSGSVDNTSSSLLVYYYQPSSTFSTSSLGLSGVSCKARDIVGNNGTASGIFSLTVIEAVGTSPAGGTAAAAAGTTHVVSSTQFAEGTTATLAANDKFKVTFTPSGATAPQSHSISVSSVSTSSVTVIISSDPITVTVNVGEEKKVDVNGDGTYDVSVKLNKIVGTKADLTVKQIAEAAPAGAGPVSGEPAPTTPTEEAGGLAWIWWVIAVVIIVVVVVVVILAKKKR